VVQVAVPTFPVSYAYYTAKNAISSTTVSPNLDTTNWTSTPVPTADSRFTQAPTAWPLHTATLHIDTVDGVSTFNLVDAPGFYNNLNFTWLRGTKDILDDLTKWGVVGEQILAQGEGDAVFGARYISGFDTPPVVNLVPDTHLPSSTTVIRGTPFLFNASGTNDANLDPVTFDWTFTPANSHVTLTPVAPLNTTANLLVNRTIGGDAQSFIVGLVATTSSSPAMTITTIGIASNVLTVGTSASVNLASTEEVFLYNIGTATFLNDLMVVVTGTSGDSFTANFTHADYTSTADTGNAVANAQFGWCNVTVPYNPSPTITFPTNPIAADRNSLVIISPTYTGIVESDDATTYLWTQVSGNPLVVSGGVTSSVLRVNTNGALIQGESSVWSLTVNDGVNSPVTASVTINIVAYPFDIQDTLQLSRSLWGPTATISQRNTTHTWVPLDVSGIYTNFQSIKRSSAFDGSDRYLLISPASVCVFGGIQPNMALLRKLFVPLDSEGNQNAIIDAVHTEDDTTFVLDSAGNLYRYSTAPLISTDNPDTTIVLSTEASMSFNKVFSTYSFNNIRIIVLTGVDGCLLLQVQNIGMTIEGTLELTVESGELYGIDNVQFVRTSNVESLSTGKILIGTIALVSANIQSINITGNIVTVVANNTYTAGHVVTFNGLTAATFLNGAKATVTSATPTQFVVSYQHANYGTTSEGTGATAVAGGKTYETLIDLSHGQIIGIFDASNLRNQFVTTGEILFETNDTYAGRPAAPILNPIGVGSLIGGDYVDLTVSWSAERPDLIQYYILESSFDEMTWTRTLINSGYVETITLPEPIGQHIYFRVQAVSTDGASPYSNIEEANTGQPPPPPVISTGFAVLFGVGFGTT
jgi:hypothetical protein